MIHDTDTNTAPVSEMPVASKSSSPTWLWSLLTGLALLGVLATIPVFGDASTLHNWTLIVMFMVLAQSWNFVGGFTGYSAFGNVAFFGLGAYTTGLLLIANVPFWLGLLAGALVAGLFAFLMGLPVLRLKGHYFAIATLGTAEALREIVTVRNVGGSGGLMSLPLPGLEAYVGFYYAFLGLSLLCLLITTWLTLGRFGYALVAIRESEQAAESLGIPTYRYKVAAYVLSSIPTALAGGLYAYWSFGIEPPFVFNVSFSVEMVLLSFLGGTGTILGPMLGAIAFESVSYMFQISSTSMHDTLLGLSITLVTIFLPQGFIRLVQGIGRLVLEYIRGTIRANVFTEGLRRVRRFITANGI
ncbi:MAG: branched-chain amino acid ABC transporter permease [Ktedonobacteraceae bacterium]|nr:branched-chain amino acid ABC transporter permease [Ktedonobacteraceae bacterium]